jgi:homoserine dehydrogenase
MTELERFQTTVERFISDNSLTPTQFGREYAADPLFVFQLRKGREPRSATRDRILAAMGITPSETQRAEA